MPHHRLRRCSPESEADLFGATASLGGADYVQSGLWRGFAVRDGNLITGQQNFSGAETADAVIRALGE